MLARIDAWIGKTLFHPPIILACQLLRQSQYAFSKAVWFLVFIADLWFFDDNSVLMFVCLMGMAVVNMLQAVLIPDAPTTSALGWRLVFWFLLGAGLLHAASKGVDWDNPLIIFMVLIAEYAKTIKTIPPRSVREKRAAARERSV